MPSPTIFQIADQWREAQPDLEAELNQQSPGAFDRLVADVHRQAKERYGNPRLSLIRVSAGPKPILIRATLESAVDAGARFEDQARLLAAASSTHGFRCVDGLYTPLDDTVDDHDA